MRPLASILTDTLALMARPDTDLGWSSPFDSMDGALEHVRRLRDQAAASDASALKEAVLLFLPTGALQEMALASGWHDQYMQLASEVDALERNP